MNTAKATPTGLALREVDRLTLAATLMGEARGEPLEGKIAVAWVVRNRMMRSIWWGIFTEADRAKLSIDPPRYSAQAVCRKPWQFSCWNTNDPSYRVCLKFLAPENLQDNLKNSQFKECLYAVDQVMAGRVPDPTFGATHYINPKIANPKWDDEATVTANIGQHRFYKDVP